MSSSTMEVGASVSRNNRSGGSSSPPPKVDKNLPSLPVHNGEKSAGRTEKRHHAAAAKLKGLFRVRSDGESGRRGIDPLKFLKVTFRSTSMLSRIVNTLWPLVPVAIICWKVLPADVPNSHLIIFVLSYLAMIPCANTIGFAGQELARKVPHVLGVLTETTIGSIVEIILFMILLVNGQFHVIQAAILGSILATMLLCLGLCFFAGGLRRDENTFSETVSEAGNGLLLTAGFALAIPTIYRRALIGGPTIQSEIEANSLNISRITSILLIIAYLAFVWFQTRTHHGIYAAVFEEDEARDHDRHQDLAKEKLTFTECVVALVVSVAFVTMMAYILVQQIEPIVEHRHVSDAFMGLILVPLVEKAAEHLTAVDEAWDNQMNFALAHVLGATLQTAMFNGPLTVIVGWGLNKQMGLEFEIFDIATLLLAIITVGNFLRDQKTNYLEGFLCVIVYIAIAVAAFFYPNLTLEGSAQGGPSGAHGE